jgi:integrase
MTHTFAATPARSRTPPRAKRAPHSKNPLTSTYSEKVQITFAMQLLHAGVDTSVIALWLGHETPQSTQHYLHADLALKQRALDRTTPPNTRPGRYRPPDALLTFLEEL